MSAGADLRRSAAARRLAGRLLFEVGARAYDTLTAQPAWRQQVRRLLDHVPTGGAPLRVLDLGTGPGVSAFALAEALPAGSRVTGVDLSAAMIARARAHHARRYAHLGGVEFLSADAAALPCDDVSFDLVTGHSFLYLLPDPVAVLREARRVARPGARAVFMEPAEGGGLASAARSVASPWDALRADPSGTARFALSMAAWRAVSATQGRMSEKRLMGLFGDAGWRFEAAHPTLGGLGLHAVAVRR